MTAWMTMTLLLVGVAMLTHALMPAVRKLAVAWGLVDHPSWRRNQTEAVPCSGGLAIYAAVVIAAVGLSLWVGVPFSSHALLALGLAGLGTLVLGVLDDRFGLHAEKKLLGQIVVVSLPLASGLTLESIQLPGLGLVEFGFMSGPITLFWYLGFINSVNLIDGLDGLASGIVCLVLGALLVVVAPADPVAAVWVVALLGAVAGFLRNNLSRRRIFLGDAGSMLLGLWLAGLTLGVSRTTPSVSTLAILAMAVPVIDTSTTILRRWRRGVSVFRADDEHLHHRLLRLGTTPRRAAACLWMLTLSAAAAGAMVYGVAGAGVLALGALAAAAIEFAYTLPRGGQPTAKEAFLYVLGLAPLAVNEEPRPRLAEVIEMQPYQRLRRAPSADHPVPPPPAKEPSKPATTGRTAAKVGAAGEAQKDVVLAATDEPR